MVGSRRQQQVLQVLFFFIIVLQPFPPPKQTNKKGGCCILSLVREFLPRYFKKNSGVFRPIGISEKEVKRLANFDFFQAHKLTTFFKGGGKFPEPPSCASLPVTVSQVGNPKSD